MLAIWWFSGVYNLGPKGASHFMRVEGLQQGWRAEWLPWDHFPCGAARMPLLVGPLRGLCIEHSRSMTPLHCSGPQTWNTPSSCLPCCYIQEASGANLLGKAPLDRRTPFCFISPTITDRSSTRSILCMEILNSI